jgi:hypothetical protein
MRLSSTLCRNTSLFVVILATVFSPFGQVVAQESDLDINNDGELNILILGTTRGIDGSAGFSPELISYELDDILRGDNEVQLTINVVFEDIYRSKPVTIGLGGGGTEYTWTHFSHSLAQYYYWPEDREMRLGQLESRNGVQWDYVVIGADPYMVETLPGYYSLGVNKVAAAVAKGGGQPLLLMVWPEDDAPGDIVHFEEYTYRTSEGAVVDLPVIPAGLAWGDLAPGMRDNSTAHPSPNGAYLSAAAIYSHLTERSAAESEYDYNDMLADIALTTVLDAGSIFHFNGCREFVSPYIGCKITDDEINYNHTGTSSERGILNGLQWIFNKAPETLQNGGTSPIHFNFGRANSNFEPNKRYQIDSTRFDFSFGFPMQDHGNHGNTSMLYGLDRRQSGTMNDTDVGVARFMAEMGELPFARAVPIRTLYAQMKDAIPGQSAYRDSWHMHRDLDKATAAFMYTILTGNCILEEEPADSTSAEWKSWMSHKIGYETAWNFMYLEGRAKGCETLSLELSANPTIGGRVEGGGDFQYGEMVDLTATPETGYNFINWTRDGKEISKELVISYKVTDNAEVVANFGIISDVITDQQNEILIYPNPAKDFIILQGFTGEVTISNANGMTIKTWNTTEQTKVDISNLEPGVYYVKGSDRIGRFVVSK